MSRNHTSDDLNYMSMAAAAEKRIVKTARALNACANEFEGELRSCQELLSAFYDAVEAREEIDRRWRPHGQATDTAKAPDDRAGSPGVEPKCGPPEVVVGIDPGAGGFVIVDRAGRVVEPPPGHLSRQLAALAEVLGEFGAKAKGLHSVPRYAGQPSPGSSVDPQGERFSRSENWFERHGLEGPDSEERRGRHAYWFGGQRFEREREKGTCGCPAGIPRSECERSCLRLLYL